MRKLHLAALVVLGAAPAFAQMSLPGSFEVSETGAAVYTVPIAVPPGTAGLEPKLTLQYNSRAGNGLLGVGWTLGGLPSIVRCPKTIAQDGTRGGVNYDANDRFCLEGERLVALGGTYGADGTEYRTEREGFSKIVSYGSAGAGPAWFKAWTKAGQILEFGNTADSRIEAQGKTTARLWAVNKVSDTGGNYFSVTYAEDNANGEYRPSRIDYTGNTNAGASPFASVRFVYEARPATDQAPLYEAGSLIKTTQKLTKIQTYVGEGLVREFRLAYEASPSTARLRLTSLAVCTLADTCLPQTSFAWQDATAGFPSAALWTSDFSSTGWAPQSSYPRVVADVNGDGRGDIVGFGSNGVYVALSTGTAFGSSALWLADHYGTQSGWSNTDTHARDVVDVNGDGLADIVGFGSDGVYVALSTGTGFTSPARWTTAFSAAGWAPQSAYPRYLADVNGDGLPDIVGFASNGVHVSLSTGSSFAAPTLWLSNQYGTQSGWTNMDTHPRIMADVDGDGRADIIGFGGDGVYVSLSTGTGFTASARWIAEFGFQSGWSSNNTYTRTIADLNGDGKADIVGFDTEGVYVSLSTGAGFAPGMRWTNAYSSTGWAPQSGYPRFVADLNGDGRPDIVGFASDRVNMSLSAGTAFTTPTFWVEDYGTQTGWSNMDSHTRTLADVDGDGRLDIVGFGTNGTKVSLANGTLAPDLLQSVTSGLGGAVAVGYGRLTAGAPLYGRDTGTNACTYPCVDMQGPMYVVSQVQTSNGIGGTYRTTYRYAGAKADQQGRGFLGFRQVIARDEQTLVEQATEYLQSWPFVGLTAKRTKTLGAVELNRTENTYAADDLGSGRRFVKLIQSVESSKELNGAALPTVTTSYQYDAYGNATQVAVSTGDGHAKTTVNTYANDLANWLLGRLTRAEVTSITP